VRLLLLVLSAAARRGSLACRPLPVWALARVVDGGGLCAQTETA
jgi:hypothetical protein